MTSFLKLLLTIFVAKQALAFTTPSFHRPLPYSSSSGYSSSSLSSSGASNDEHDILLRCARGLPTSRTPVWLMRQAGRYQASFRKFSEKYPFRHRSETTDIAVSLSLAPLEEFGVDGVVFFSDILTPLPAMGIDFDILPGKGPQISTKIRTIEDVEKLTPLGDASAKLPFIGEILRKLRDEVKNRSTLIGFVGAPWTLAAYVIEQKSSKNCAEIKKMQYHQPEVVEAFIDKIAVMVGEYACHQIDNGAQIIQIFESWAHHLSPDNFSTWALPALKTSVQIIKKKHPDVPVVFYANGGSSWLELQKEVGADMICLDWKCDMAKAREILGESFPVSGNIDPHVLYGTEDDIRSAVRENIRNAGGAGNRHLLNLGHGVMKDVSEDAVRWLVDEAKKS